MHPLISRITSLAGRWLPWSFPAKIALGAIIGALGSAGFLGYVSEYATYYYAIRMGFRPPLEGIPYLSATVGLGSLVLLLIASSIFCLQVVSFSALIWIIKAYLIRLELLDERYSKLRLLIVGEFERLRLAFEKRPLILCSAAATVFALATWTLFGLIPEKVHISPMLVFGLVALQAINAFLFLLATFRPTYVWLLGITAALSFILVALLAMFSTSIYASFLRSVGYGGGIPVSLQVKDNQGGSQNLNGEYFLMLRTTDSLLLLSSSGHEFVEIPREQVSALKHKPGGLSKLPFWEPSP